MPISSHSHTLLPLRRATRTRTQSRLCPSHTSTYSIDLFARDGSSMQDLLSWQLSPGSPRHQDVISFYNRAVGGCTNLHVPFSEWTPGLFSKCPVFHASLCFSVRHSGCSRLGLLLSVLLSKLLSTFRFGPMVSFFLAVHLRGELLAPAVSLCFCLS